jgi:hypothetical protein
LRLCDDPVGDLCVPKTSCTRKVGCDNEAFHGRLRSIDDDFYVSILPPFVSTAKTAIVKYARQNVTLLPPLGLKQKS